MIADDAVLAGRRYTGSLPCPSGPAVAVRGVARGRWTVGYSWMSLSLKGKVHLKT